MTKTTQSHHTLLQRIVQLKNDCNDILLDKKPVVPKFFLEQIARMHTGFFITDFAQAYTMDGREASHLKGLTKKDQTEYIRKKKGFFPVQTMTHALTEENEHLAKKLSARGVQNFRIMGTDSNLRRIGERNDAYDDADSFILGKSDFNGVKEFLEAVEKRLKGDDPHSHKPIILHNHNGYWDPVLKGLGISRDNIRWLESHNIYMGNRLSRVEAIYESCNIDKSREPEAVTPQLSIKPGATILVATRQNRKIHELQRIFDALGADIRVLPFHVVVGRPREAEEISGTYIGNNYEKIQAAQEKISGLSKTEFASRLRRYGLSPDNTFVLCDDRGAEFETNFFAEHEFKDLRKHLNPHKRGLGVEMANFLRAVANAGDMYHLIEKAFKSMEAAGRNPTRNSFDYSCYAIAPITDLSHPLIMTATTQDEIVENPQFDTRIGYSEDFLKLKGSPYASKNKTPNFMARHSSMALAIAGIAKVTGLLAARDLEAQAPSLAQDYAQNAYDNRQGRWKIGMPQSSSLPNSDGGKRIIDKGFQQRFALVAENPKYDLSRMHTFTVVDPEGNKSTWPSRLVAADQYSKDVDGFYFRPVGPAKSTLEYFARGFSFCTTTVGKQTFAPHFHPKPHVVDVRYAKDEIENYEYLHKLGFIGDAAHYLMDQVDSKSEAQRIFTRKLKNYVRPDDMDVPMSVEGNVPEGLFNVTFYASASNRGEAANAEAFRGGELSAEAGFNCINGGGNDGLMKSVSDGVISFRTKERAAKQDQVVVNGLTSIQCIDTIESEGEYPHADSKERHPTIFHRMDNLQKTDAEVFLPGGAGTLQEFYATCMERIITKRIENRPLILVNQKIQCGDELLGVWDKLIETLPADSMKLCNIHIVSTVDEAIEICKETRAKLGMERIMKTNPYLTANENSFEPARAPKVA